MAAEITDQAGRKTRTLSEKNAAEAAGQTGTDLRQAYMAALCSGIWPVRYMRNAASLSLQEQLKIAESGAAVIGAGGLGANAVMILARTGIGQLCIADPDVFEESNLNRQITAAPETIGMPKVLAAEKMVKSVNPAVEVKTFQTALTLENAPEILAEADIAIDALDSPSSRLVLAEACRRQAIPMIHSAIAGFEGQVMTLFPGDRGLEMIYTENSCQDPGQAPAEAVMGVPGVTPAVLAALEAMEAVKILLGRGRVLENRMLYVDLENSGFVELSFGKDNGQEGN